MPDDDAGIQVQPDGPYIVRGGVPLVARESVETEHGEPIAWRTRGGYEEAGEMYALCRCGKSDNRPFCDGTHARIDFNGAETAPTNTAAERQETISGSGITLYDDRGALCIGAGFCGSRLKNVWEMMDEADESTVRAQIGAMVERCPSGALRYALGAELEPIEAPLGAQIGVEAAGPLWVTGGVALERADGEAVEQRNRVTLCRCGASQNKPLCDGAHRSNGFEAGGA